MSFRSGWLGMGAVAAVLCVLVAGLIVEGYVRHMPSGDQAGAALGMMFFLLWILPAATVPLVASVRPAPSPTDPPPARVPAWIGLLLLGSGLLLLIFLALYVAVEVLPSMGRVAVLRPSQVVIGASYVGLLLGFAGIWIVLGTVALHGPGAKSARALPTLFLLTALVALVVNAALLAQAFRGVVPGNNPWALLIQNFLFFSTPSLLVTIFLTWTAWNVVRSRKRAATDH